MSYNYTPIYSDPKESLTHDLRLFLLDFMSGINYLPFKEFDDTTPFNAFQSLSTNSEDSDDSNNLYKIYLSIKLVRSHYNEKKLETLEDIISFFKVHAIEINNLANFDRKSLPEGQDNFTSEHLIKLAIAGRSFAVQTKKYLKDNCDKIKTLCNIAAPSKEPSSTTALLAAVTQASSKPNVFTEEAKKSPATTSSTKSNSFQNTESHKDTDDNNKKKSSPCCCRCM
jgi:hypothetical protein